MSTDLTTAPRPLALNVDELQRIERYKEQSRTTLTLVEGFKITKADDATTAAAQLVAIRGELKRRDEERMVITRPVDSFKSAVIEAYREGTTLLERADKALTAAVGEWQKKEQARLRAEEAERQRIADEAARKAREQAEKARQAVLAADTAEEADAAVAALENAQERADEAEMTVAAPTAAPTRLAGISSRVTFKAGAIDLAELVTEAARRLATGDDSYLLYLQANESAINAIIKSTKGAAKIKGVTVAESSTTAVRTR